MKIDNQKILFLQDKLDEATMLYYEQKGGKLKYLACLDAVVNAFLTNNDLDNEKIDEILECIDQYPYSSEEIRQALLYLVIKGFKHQNLDLDSITPDRIGVICAHLMDALFEQEEAKKIFLLDLNLGTGNLLFTINNYSHFDFHLIGIENNETLVKVAQNFSEMMMVDLQIFFQDALNDNFSQADLIIADVDQYDYHRDNYHSPLTDLNISYFPYLLMEKHQYSGDENTKYLFIIPNDFFSQNGSDEFQKAIGDTLEMVALIVLPETMFVDQTKAKSILIMKKQTYDHKHPISVYKLPSIGDRDAFLTIMKEIKTDLKAKFLRK